MHPKARLFIALLPFLTITAIAPLAQAFNSDHLKQLLKGNQCSNCDLSGALLEGTNLAGANLQNTNLSNANLSGTNLSGANLEGANLQNATLNNVYAFRANLTGTNFSNAILQNANLRETTLIGTNFTRADLRSVNLSNMELSGAVFSGANLSKANLSGVIAVTLKPLISMDETQNLVEILGPQWNRLIVQSMCDPDIVTAAFGFETDPMPSQIKNLPIVGVNWSNVDFSEADLSNALLPKINLTGAKLIRSNLKNTCLFQAQVKNTNFEEADLTLANLKDVNLKEAPDYLVLRLKEREALQFVGGMTRAQQAYHLEKDRFATNLESIQMGIKPDTADYRYRLFVAPDRYPAALQVAIPKTSDLLTFLGLVYATKLDGQTAAIANLCVSEKPGTPMPLWSAIDYKNPKKGGPIACPSGFTPVK